MKLLLALLCAAPILGIKWVHTEDPRVSLGSYAGA